MRLKVLLNNKYGRKSLFMSYNHKKIHFKGGAECKLVLGWKSQEIGIEVEGYKLHNKNYFSK